jgi:hypothetical protein
MLPLVLLLSVAAGGAGTCADHRGGEAVGIESLQGIEEAYAVAEYDFEDRLGELGLMGSTLAREAMAAGEHPADVQLALGATVDPSSAQKE